jgi:hypothetical protein
MPNTLVKPHKTAAELAELIRNSIGNSDLRVAVFPTTSGWKAKVYPEPRDNAARLKAAVEEKATLLGERYELTQ